ncbi:MAG: hypothetical protein LAT55_12095 [Opitutales bacterium]|nr:hypothetical protein [Opitutales bacterium]
MDDLTTIKGVGPATAKLLNEGGIMSFDDLQDVDPSNPPVELGGGLTWEYLMDEAADFVADKPSENGDGANEQHGDRAGSGPGQEGAGAGVSAGSESVAPDGARIPERDGADSQSAPGREAGNGDAGASPEKGAATQPTEEEGARRASVTVKGPRRGRWRAGRHFTHEPAAAPPQKDEGSKRPSSSRIAFEGPRFEFSRVVAEMDDFTKIEGVDPDTARRLKEAGFETLGDLLNASVHRPPFDLDDGLDWSQLLNAAWILYDTQMAAGGYDKSDGSQRLMPVVLPAPTGATVTVKGPRRGRWRAGRHFTHEPVTIPLAELSDDQVAALQGDPTLTVQIVE